MSKTLKIFAVAFFTLTTAAAPVTAAGRFDTVTDLEIQLWAEYDKPMVLVMIDGWTPKDVPLPAEVILPIVEGAEVHMSCSISAGGAHIHESFEVQSDEDGKYVTFVARERRFHLEYYYNPFQNIPTRRFRFSFRSPYNINSLRADVQEPLGSVNFRVTPGAEYSIRNDLGILVHKLNQGELGKGEEFIVNVDYTKDDLVPSAMRQGNADSGMSFYQKIALFVGVAMLLIIGYTAFRSSSRSGYGGRKTVRRKKAQVTYERKKKRVSRGATPNFCSNCGSSLQPADAFCGSCGSKVGSGTVEEHRA